MKKDKAAKRDLRWARVDTWVNESGGRITKFTPIKAASEAEWEGEGIVKDEIAKASSTAVFPIKAENIDQAVEKFEGHRKIAERKFCEENLKADSKIEIPTVQVPKFKRRR